VGNREKPKEKRKKKKEDNSRNPVRKKKNETGPNHGSDVESERKKNPIQEEATAWREFGGGGVNIHPKGPFSPKHLPPGGRGKKKAPAEKGTGPFKFKRLFTTKGKKEIQGSKKKKKAQGGKGEQKLAGVERRWRDRLGGGKGGGGEKTTKKCAENKQKKKTPFPLKKKV